MTKATWGRVLDEFGKALQEPSPPGPEAKAPWARFLSQKVERVTEKTQRPLVIYASACTSSAKGLSGAHVQIDQSDRVGFHDVVEKLEGPELDLLLHSPGGFPEAAESIVREIRSKFSHVRVIVPAYAKSAATMMALAADEILLDEDAELGPIDPQMMTPNGVAPAEAIKEQFLKAAKEVQTDPSKIAIWMPILQPMGPALLVQCDSAIKLSKELVRTWLAAYMFKGASKAKERATRVVNFLGNHKKLKSHARPIKLADLANFGLKLENLRKDEDLHGRVWELYCTLDILFANAPFYKIFYNSRGDAMVRQSGVVIAQPQPVQQPEQPPQPPAQQRN